MSIEELEFWQSQDLLKANVTEAIKRINYLILFYKWIEELGDGEIVKYNITLQRISKMWKAIMTIVLNGMAARKWINNSSSFISILWSFSSSYAIFSDFLLSNIVCIKCICFLSFLFSLKFHNFSHIFASVVSSSAWELSGIPCHIGVFILNNSSTLFNLRLRIMSDYFIVLLTFWILTSLFHCIIFFLESRIPVSVITRSINLNFVK